MTFRQLLILHIYSCFRFSIVTPIKKIEPILPMNLRFKVKKNIFVLNQWNQLHVPISVISVESNYFDLESIETDISLNL